MCRCVSLHATRHTLCTLLALCQHEDSILFSLFSLLFPPYFHILVIFSSYSFHILFTFSSQCLRTVSPQALQGEGIDLPSTFLQEVIDRLIGILLPSKMKKNMMGAKEAKGGAEKTREAPAASAASAASTCVRFDERVRQGAAIGLANILGCGLGCGIR